MTMSPTSAPTTAMPTLAPTVVSPTTGAPGSIQKCFEDCLLNLPSSEVNDPNWDYTVCVMFPLFGLLAGIASYSCCIVRRKAMPGNILLLMLIVSSVFAIGLTSLFGILSGARGNDYHVKKCITQCNLG